MTTVQMMTTTSPSFSITTSWIRRLPCLIPLTSVLAQWIRPNETPAFVEALNHTTPARCDLCESLTPTDDIVHSHHVWYPDTNVFGPTGPPVCSAATCHRGECWLAMRADFDEVEPDKFHRPSFGVAPSHLPDRTLHPLRDFRRVLHPNQDPAECACN